MHISKVNIHKIVLPLLGRIMNIGLLKTSVSIYICIYEYMYMNICIYVYLYMYIYTYIYTYNIKGKYAQYCFTIAGPDNENEHWTIEHECIYIHSITPSERT
jgi:hypothetical protein